MFSPEPRLGIQLEPGRRTSAEGRIYTAEFTRLAERVSLLVEVWLSSDEGTALQETRLEAWLPMERGLLQLGGEARAASYERLEEPLNPALRQLLAAVEVQHALARQTPPYRFKLCLLTPAVFQNGWYPDGLTPQADGRGPLQFTLRDVPCTLIAAVVGKPVPLSGWDLANNRPKAMVRAVPMGSVYYFETEVAPEVVIRTFHFRTLDTKQPDAAELPKIGFGLVAVGTWNYAEPF